MEQGQGQDVPETEKIPGGEETHWRRGHDLQRDGRPWKMHWCPEVREAEAHTNRQGQSP